MNPNLMDDDSLTGTQLSANAISLTDAQIDTAIMISQRATNEAQQWQSYLNALALFGIEQWFQERSPEFILQSEWLQQRIPSGIIQPESIAMLEVQQFRLFLVTTESSEDDMIAVPQSIINSGNSHFYVLVEVIEEFAQVRVSGCLRQDHLIQQRVNQLVVEDDLYLLPIDWFSTAPSQLLLYLQHLESAAFSIPAAVSSTVSTGIGDRIQPVIQSAVNTGLWIRNQLDQVAQDVAWILLPPTLSPAMRSMRSPSEQLDRVMSELIARNQIELPPQIGNAYQDISLAGVVLRLYAVTWEIAAPNGATEWMLLLILGTPPEGRLPAGVRLQICDETQILTEQISTENSRNNFLYAQVSGDVGEKFYVTLTLNQESHHLPPLTFNPESSR